MGCGEGQAQDRNKGVNKAKKPILPLAVGVANGNAATVL